MNDSLFNDAAPPAHHKAPPGTSSVAAERIAGHTKVLRSRVFTFIAEQGPHGATDAEVELATGMRAQTISPRRGELRAMGLVVDSGSRRLTPRGRPAAVWVLPEHAPQAPTMPSEEPGNEPESARGAA